MVLRRDRGGLPVPAVCGRGAAAAARRRRARHGGQWMGGQGAWAEAAWLCGRGAVGCRVFGGQRCTALHAGTAGKHSGGRWSLDCCSSPFSTMWGSGRFARPLPLQLSPPWQPSESFRMSAPTSLAKPTCCRSPPSAPATTMLPLQPAAMALTPALNAAVLSVHSAHPACPPWWPASLQKLAAQQTAMCERAVLVGAGGIVGGARKQNADGRRG